LQKFSLNQLLQLKHLYFCCYIMKKKSLYYLGFFGVLLVLFWIDWQFLQKHSTKVNCKRMLMYRNFHF
jgi:hypothetical protein